MAELPHLNSTRAEESHRFPGLIKHRFWVGRIVVVAKDMDQNQTDLSVSPSFGIGRL